MLVTGTKCLNGLTWDFCEYKSIYLFSIYYDSSIQNPLVRSYFFMSQALELGRFIPHIRHLVCQMHRWSK